MTGESFFSEFYLACESGDLEGVKKICLELVDIEFALINQIEWNGNTGLHIASTKGYKEIVQFLLEIFGVVRHRVNIQGLTAYDMATNKEIRQLFHRRLNDKVERYSQTFEDVDDITTYRRSKEDIEQNEIDTDNDDYYRNEYITEYNYPTALLGIQTSQAIKLKYFPQRHFRKIYMKVGSIYSIILKGYLLWNIQLMQFFEMNSRLFLTNISQLTILNIDMLAFY